MTAVMMIRTVMLHASFNGKRTPSIPAKRSVSHKTDEAVQEQSVDKKPRNGSRTHNSERTNNPVTGRLNSIVAGTEVSEVVPNTRALNSVRARFADKPMISVLTTARKAR